MPITKVDTFQQDIVEEIKRKDDVYSKIPTTPVEKTEETLKKPILPLLTFILFIITLLSVLGFSLYYFYSTYIATKEKEAPLVSNIVKKTNPSILPLSKTLQDDLGLYIQNVEKRNEGYIVSLVPNSPVFAYMLKNEQLYIEELAQSISPLAQETKSTAPKSVATSTASSTTQHATTTGGTIATSTQVATTTPSLSKNKKTTGVGAKSASSTEPLVQQAPEEIVSIPFTSAATSSDFKDLTLSNQSMRVWEKNGQMVVYAFVNLQTLVISSSPEGVLALRNAILAR